MRRVKPLSWVQPGKNMKPFRALLSKKGAILGGTFGALVCCPAVAQDSMRSPGDFFSPNFMNEERLEATNKKPTPATSPSSEKESDGERTEGQVDFFGSPAEATTTPTPTKGAIVGESEQKVISVSGFIAGKSIGEALVAVAEIGRFLKDRDIPVRHFSVVCNVFDYTKAVGDSFKRVGEKPELLDGFNWISPHLRMIHEVPKRYKVTHSPVWLIETKKGETIIEGGAPPLEELISDQGLFEIPQGGEEVKELPPPPAFIGSSSQTAAGSATPTSAVIPPSTPSR